MAILQPKKEEYTITPTPYPAKTQTSTTSIKGTETRATCVSFSDKILITISQNGRLAHWTHVPLDLTSTTLDSSLPSAPYNPSSYDSEQDSEPSDLLPLHHLTATTILGGTVPEIDVLGQTLATQIASAILTRNSSEKRMLVLGMGLERSMSGREEFTEIVGLVLGVL